MVSDAYPESVPADLRTSDMLYIRSSPLVPNHTTTRWARTHPSLKRLGSVLRLLMAFAIPPSAEKASKAVSKGITGHKTVRKIKELQTPAPIYKPCELSYGRP